MASFTLLRSGAWRVQVRRKGAYVAETFLRKTEAQDWAREAEIAIDRGLKPPRRGQTAPKKGQTTLGHLIDLHIADMNDVGRELARSKKSVANRAPPARAEHRAGMSEASPRRQALPGTRNS